MSKRNNSGKPKKKKGKANSQTQDFKEMNKELKLISQTLDKGQNLQRSTVRDIQFPVLKRNKVYTFVRSFSPTALTLTSTVDLPFSVFISLSLFPDASEFTTLFDSYRIGVVEIQSSPYVGAPNVSGSTHTVIDYDDSSGLGSIAACQEYDSYQVNLTASSWTRTLQPRAANAAYSGVFTSFSQMPPRTWCDVASPGILYYGVKGFIPASTFAGGPAIINEFNVTAILQFRNTR